MGRHSNAPLTPEGRRRLIERIESGRPISHVADEAGVSRQRLGEWYRRWLEEGDEGLVDRSSRDAGVKHRRTRRQTPRTNGKVERFNQTMKDEWLYVRVYTSEEGRREALVPFLNDYNHDRPHTSIGNRPPVSRAPEPGPKLDGSLLIAQTPEERGQLTLDLSGDNNVAGEHS